MRTWVALIVAPLLALTDQTVAFALVHWACAQQSIWVVHLSHIVFLATTAAAAGEDAPRADYELLFSQRRIGGG